MIWAVHLADGVVRADWQTCGVVLAVALMIPGAYRIPDETIPRVGLLTAVFFVASLIHLPVGVGKVHLLLNGLLGVILGRRAGLAVGVGLFLQAALLGHGGFWVWGVNTCVMALPAFAAAIVFRLARPLPRRLLPAVGFLLGAGSVLLTVTLQYFAIRFGSLPDVEWASAVIWLLHLPVAAVEGLVLASVLPYLARARPDVLFPDLGERK